MTFGLKSTSTRRQQLLVDVAVHFVQARGKSARVFKLKRITLAPRETVSLSTKFSLAVHTTRVPRAGEHLVEVIVNGVSFPAGSFMVKAARSR